MKSIAKGFFAVAFVIGLSGLLRADIFMKQRQHTDPMTVMGKTQPARDEVHTVWLTPQGTRNDDPARSIIFRLDKNVIYVLDHKKKTVTEIPLGKMKMPGMDAGENPEANTAMQEMMKNMMKMKVTVKATGEKKKINGWNCSKYIQVLETGMGQHQSEIWATEDIRVDYDLISRYSAAMMAQMPGAAAGMDDIAKEMKKVKGMPVYTVSSTPMMGTVVKSTTELLEWKEGKAPAGILDVPAGYKTTSLDQM
ncbi:MAG TPA: hypothetical protein VGB38_08605 [bacterium]